MDDLLKVRGKVYKTLATRVDEVDAAGSYDTGSPSTRALVLEGVQGFINDLPTGRGHLYIKLSWNRADPPEPVECECADGS